MELADHIEEAQRAGLTIVWAHISTRHEARYRTGWESLRRTAPWEGYCMVQGDERAHRHVLASGGPELASWLRQAGGRLIGDTQVAVVGETRADRVHVGGYMADNAERFAQQQRRSGAGPIKPVSRSRL